jgi:P-type conjugative transfer protein TrbL
MFGFLNDTLAAFLQAIQNVWEPVFQTGGIDILLTIGAIALAIYSLNLLATQDVAGFVLGMTYTFIALAVLHEVFLKSEYLATSILNMFIQWGQQISGMSPNVLTPSGIMETGFQLARIFWDASGGASWFYAPTSTLATVICAIVVSIAFAIASIIYLLALVNVYALIAAASVLLAFAGLPWTWTMFPGWALSVFSSCIKIFFLLAVLAIGLNEATAWTATMAATSGTIVDNINLAVEASVESVLFLGLVYYIPGLMASLVLGAVGPVMHAGEAMLGSLTAGAAGDAADRAMKAPRAAGNAAVKAGQGLATVAKMLLR